MRRCTHTNRVHCRTWPSRGVLAGQQRAARLEGDVGGGAAQVYSNPVTLTLAHVHGETPLSVGKLVFVVDLKRSEPNGVGVFSAHVRNLMDTGVTPPPYLHTHTPQSLLPDPGGELSIARARHVAFVCWSRAIKSQVA